MPDNGDLSRIVTIGGSAGGIEALRHIVRHLPADFPAPICVVFHIAPDSPGLVPSIIQSAGPLPAQHATHNDQLVPGRIYIAPPDHHLILTSGGTLLGSGPKENLFRPAIDPLFRSAALHYGAGCIGVILSGGLDDGVAGLAAIKAVGGVAIVQQPEEAEVKSMPETALAKVAVDHCLPAAGIAARLRDLAGQTVGEGRSLRETETALDIETRIAAGVDAANLDLAVLGKLSPLTCPDCAGVLRRMNGEPLRYRCHTGHAHTAQTLAYALRRRSEDAIWAALQRLRERGMFLRDLAAKYDVGGARIEADEVDALADHIHKLLLKVDDPAGG